MVNFAELTVLRAYDLNIVTANIYIVIRRFETKIHSLILIIQNFGFWREELLCNNEKWASLIYFLRDEKIII